MPPDPSGLLPSHLPADRHALLAVAATFAINGAVLSSLLPRYPQIVATTGASEAAFGFALAAIGVGGFVGSALVPVVAARVGLRRVVVIAGIVLALAALAVALAPSVGVLAFAFALGGAADGVHDVSMNEVGLGEQSRRRRSVMGRLHGAWSLGATAAGAVGALMAGLDVPVPVHVAGVAGVAVVAQLAVARWLRERPVLEESVQANVAEGGRVDGGLVDGGLVDGGLVEGGAAPSGAAPSRAADGRDRGLPRLTARTGAIPAAGSDPADALAAVAAVLPRRWTVLLLLAAVTLAAMAAEGVALDWSALTLLRALDATPGLAGLGPVVFSAGVLLGRGFTDPAVDRFGPQRVVRVSGLLSAAAMGIGLVVGAATGSAWPVLVALAVAGIGAAATFPLMFGAGDLVAQRLRLPAGSGASIVGTLPRLGGLILPVAVGLIAAGLGLVAALGVMVVGALAVAALLPRLLRPA